MGETASSDEHKILAGRGAGGFMREAGIDKTMAFRRRELARSFPGRTPEEIEYLAGSVSSWVDPNRSALRGRFWFARALASMSPGNEITNLVYTANNASSRLPSVLGYPEEIAKLLLPIDKARHHRFAYIREMLGPDQKIKGLLAALSLQQYHSEQPVSYYAYEEEAGVHDMLEEWGLKPQVAGTEELWSFGEDARPAVQIPYQGIGAEAIMRKIIEVEGIEEAFHSARPLDGLDQ